MSILIKQLCLESKIEKVPRGIKGQKSSKNTTSSRILVSRNGAQVSPNFILN